MTVKTFKCLGCHRERPVNLRSREQKYCGQVVCQRARKREWQRKKTATDPDYQENQRNAQSKWQEKNPHYWRNYRKNRQKNLPSEPVRRAAKTDTLTPIFRLIPGKYEIVFAAPSGVKMDAIRVKIFADSEGYQDANKDSIVFPVSSEYDTKRKVRPRD